MRKIELDGADNARDLGGIVTGDGRVIKEGRLIRSNHLSSLTKRDINCLEKTCHLKKIIDLRTDAEIEEQPDCKVPGAEWLHIPLIEEIAVGITHEKSTDMIAALGAMPDVSGLYRQIMTNAFSIAQLARVFEEILNVEDGAVLWHCTEGKDRCGIVSALTLALLGVEREVITADYLMTNQASGKRADAYRALALEKLGDEAAADKVRRLFVADEAYLKAAFDAIEEESGSVEVFLRERLDITDAQRDAFRERCLA